VEREYSLGPPPLLLSGCEAQTTLAATLVSDGGSKHHQVAHGGSHAMFTLTIAGACVRPPTARRFGKSSAVAASTSFSSLQTPNRPFPEETPPAMEGRFRGAPGILECP